MVVVGQELEAKYFFLDCVSEFRRENHQYYVLNILNAHTLS